MIDALTFIKTRLEASAPLVEIVPADRIYRGRLPSGDNKFTPQDGPGIVISAAGGNAHAEIGGLQSSRIQVRTWALTGSDAMEVYIALFNALHGSTWSAGVGKAISCLEEQQPQAITDQDTKWETVLAFYLVKITDATPPGDGITLEEGDGFLLQES